MKKTFLCAATLVFTIIIAFCFNWIRPATVAVFVIAVITLSITIKEIRSTIHEIKRDTD